jgi:hypothetical protein
MNSRSTLTLKPRTLPRTAIDVSPKANFDRFWFVWNPARTRPKKRHGTLGQATAEVGRLRAAFPTETFHVFEARRCDV